MVGRLLGRFGDILGSVVAAILQLALTIVIGPIVLLLIGTDAALSIARREPRITLPSSGIDLGAADDGQVDLTRVADAITSRCKIEVTTVRPAPGEIELSSDMTVGLPAAIGVIADLDGEDCIEVSIGLWGEHGVEGHDEWRSDVAVALVAAYLDYGITCRVVKGHTLGFLWLDDAGVWRCVRPEGESTFHQTRFRDLPGRPASTTERAQWLALMRSSPSN